MKSLTEVFHYWLICKPHYFRTWMDNISTQGMHQTSEKPIGFYYREHKVYFEDDTLPELVFHLMEHEEDSEGIEESLKPMYREFQAAYYNEFPERIHKN